MTNSKPKLKKGSKDTLVKKMFYTFLSIYAAILTGTMALSFWQTIDSRINNRTNINSKNTKEIDIYSHIQNEVDRSYIRFMGLFNLALALTGISGWLLRQSIINKMADDVRGDFNKRFETIENELQIRLNEIYKEFEVLFKSLESQYQKSKSKEEIKDIYEKLHYTTPKNFLLNPFIEKESKENFEKIISSIEQLCSNFEYLAEKNPDLFTIKEWEALGNGFIVTVKYYLRGHYIQDPIDNKTTIKFLEKALKYYEIVLDIQPEAYKTLFRLAYVQSMLEKHESAIINFIKVISLIESNNLEYKLLANTYIFYGLTLSKIENNEEARIKEAIELVNKAIVICEKNPIDLSEESTFAYYNKACYEALLYKHNPSNNSYKEEALNALRKAIEASPGLKETVTNDSDLESIKEDKRFKKIVEKEK